MLQHKHLIVRSEVKNPPNNEHQIVGWAKSLIESITCVTVIETSHVAIHVWDECKPGLIQLDVYTCGPLDIQKVFDALQQFEPEKVEYKFLDREKNLSSL